MIANFQKGPAPWLILLAVAVLGLVMFFKLNSTSNVYNSLRIKNLMDEARSQAQVYFESQTPRAYTASTMLLPAPFCSGDMFYGNFTNNLSSLTGSASAWPRGTTLSCQATALQFAISASLPPGDGPGETANTWCVDSSGKSIWIKNHLVVGDTNCN
ncbi:MAG: hypothetical protein AAB660_00555 [Patescibacteria group bacterium]